MTVQHRDRRTRVRSARREALRLMPESGDLAPLITAVAARRGRPIRVLPFDLAADAPSGVWVCTEDVDYVFHARDIAPQHRVVVVCHELAHMLLDHEPLERPSATASVAPSIAPAVAARFFNRHDYDDEIETDAEDLGTWISTELTRRSAALRAVEDNIISTRLR